MWEYLIHTSVMSTQTYTPTKIINTTPYLFQIMIKYFETNFRIYYFTFIYAIFHNIFKQLTNPSKIVYDFNLGDLWNLC